MNVSHNARSRVRLVPALLLFSTMVPAVTASRSFESGVNPSTACGLVTRTEAAAALGKPVPAGSEKTMTFPLLGRPVKAQFCFYGSEVSLVRYELGAAAPALFTQYRQSLTSDDDYQVVKGVGDDAFVAKGQIAIRKGQTGLIIDVGQNRGGGAKERAAEKGLALLAVGRL